MREPLNPAETWMAHALASAQHSYAAPNPSVGCVIVRDGVLVGAGCSSRAGGPHAEIVALQNAGREAAGADVYVTLEPCNHTGRTGPCSEALIRAGVRSVTIGCSDPNPKAAGGAQTLRRAGIEVQFGVLAEQCEWHHRVFLTAMRENRARVALKVAMSLDGRVALPSGASRWITGAQARSRGRLLRRELGSVLVGRGTVEADNPDLTVRDGLEKQWDDPTRIVLDPQGASDPSSNVFRGSPRTIWLKQGGEVPLAFTQEGQVDLLALRKTLLVEGIQGILIEGGPKTWSAFLAQDAVDELHFFVAPKLLGHGRPWLEASLPNPLQVPNAWVLSRAPVSIGDDLHLIYAKLKH